MKNKRYIFLTGVPGSRWGRIEEMMYQVSDLVDTSCKFNHQHDNPKNGTTHIYTFWGPYHEHGDQFDRLDLLGPERVMQIIDEAYDDDDPRPIRIIRCHWFAYQLDWIKENMPWVDILMAIRDPEMAMRWWHKSGGWDITYPNYKWFSTSEVLNREIMTQHKLMVKFMRENKLSQKFNLSKANEWFAENMPEYTEFQKPIKHNENDQTVWPVLYKGTRDE